MSWNGSGGDQGPWGQRPQNPQQPDLEQILRAAKEKFGGGGGGNLPGGKMSLLFILGVVILGWMATGIYVVALDEQAVITRFGKYVETTEPGPHLHLPWPIETVEAKPKVTIIQSTSVGLPSNFRGSRGAKDESKMLTGDENIVDINMIVQFKIKDAADYLFKIVHERGDPSLVVRRAAEAAIREIVGKNKIDEVLTSGKERIQSETEVLVQEILDKYRSGLEVTKVQLKQVQPPDQVVQSFKDVASAREDKVRKTNEAEGYRADILPKAKGDAVRMINEAEAYKQSKVARAKGDVARFNSLYTAYRDAKDVTRTRLYLETMEEVMSRANKVILDPDAAKGVLPHLPLDSRIFGTSKPQPAQR
ncbi:FtsH protease activity modulator HflK [Magnetococcus sp. PR-3]|uniref:FtsH protease activity modulator HflK n=1 Tax=Magnetococcus sp. PR-3 TaxID=3120355 RepID=UPI002FCE2FB4